MHEVQYEQCLPCEVRKRAATKINILHHRWMTDIFLSFKSGHSEKM